MTTSADPRRGILLSGWTRKSHSASFTTTCPTVSSSTGGASPRLTPTPFDTINASNTPRPRSGRRPRRTQTGPRFSRPILLLLYLEEAHPAELREFADVGVEHERAGETVAKLQDPALPLSEYPRVGE